MVENGPKEATLVQLLVTATSWDHLQAGNNRAKAWVIFDGGGAQDVVKRGAFKVSRGRLETSAATREMVCGDSKTVDWSRGRCRQGND